MPELRLTLQALQPLRLPIAHQHALQAMLYHTLSVTDPVMSRMLHENKPGWNRRNYAPFVFSRLRGQKTANGKQLTYEGNLSFSIRSCSPALLEAWHKSFLHVESIRLLQQPLNVLQAECFEPEIPSERVRIRMLTPIVLHETLPDGHIHYLSAQQDEFYEYARANFERKWTALTSLPLPGDISLSPVKFSQAHRCVTSFKNGTVCGWYGSYHLHAPIEAIRFLMNTGVGERNGQGFGYFNLSGPSDG